MDPDAITRSDDTVTVSLPLAAASHPYVRACTNLVNAAWIREDAEGISLPWGTVAWSGASGAWVCTITTSAPQAFFYFEYLQPGETKIVNNGVTDLTGGIIFNGTKYYPTVNGNKLEFVAQ